MIKIYDYYYIELLKKLNLWSPFNIVGIYDKTTEMKNGSGPELESAMFIKPNPKKTLELLGFGTKTGTSG